MGYVDYRRDLLAEPFDVDGVLHRYFHTGQSALFLGADPREEPNFKRRIGGLIAAEFGVKCHPLQLVICGSAHLGFSPVPSKLGQPFNPETSDVDIAVVSPELFDRWWTELQEVENLAEPQRRPIAADLFWGFIDPSKVRHMSETGKTWWNLFGGIQIERARAVRGRLYRSYWNMQNYHKQAVLGGREELTSMRRPG